jgi:transposase
MLALSSSVRYFIYGEPTDMRLGINSLAGLVRSRLGCDPMSGDVFLFLGKRSNQVRLLPWDRDGFAMYIKKLEQGTFERLRLGGNAITIGQLNLLLQGVKLESLCYTKRYEETLLAVYEKEDLISDLQSELDKLLRHIFGFKSEKRTGNVGESQLGLFELDTTKAVQEQLAESETASEKTSPKERAKGA